MDFKQLEVFVAVVKHQSFSKAARELFLTQPTVSAHIQNLERELDTVLVNRSNKVITLTKSGEILYNHAIYILNNCKRAMYDIKEYSGKIEGIIDIACSSIPETYILPEFIKDFSASYPDVKFSISHYDSQYAISEILNERVSFGLVGTKINNPQIKYIDLINDELVLIAPANLNIKNDNGYIELDELKNLNFIMRKDGSGTRMLTMRTLSKNNFAADKLNIIAHVESNEAIKEMVRIGLGVSFISKMSAIGYVNSNKLKLYRIKGVDFARQFYFIYSKKKTFTPLEDKFLDKLCENFNVEK
ncbi:selenium metabolism-associated LysR family transcriptional regulator [Clostridioides mangenotii]|uniref:selenium metabolism-associated LysR family transcriptional regulator n=1 Tax=Metaclostridioides mangenotii TaxID=1540 RepID=UPI00214A5E8F|nr:selenium metabolism-associated LysR family transcriptional regulator [Clostridioides mangenotii]MCR1954330.1 selenium metabolism-associated LysR family transcriptional regulator [Clostridioides mangenotii]